MQLFHRFDGGLLKAVVSLSKRRVSSYSSLRSSVVFLPEPPRATEVLSTLQLSGYAEYPSSLKSIIEQFLEGCGVPNEPLGLEYGVEGIAQQVNEDLGDSGARSRLLLRAATSSSSLMPQSDISVSAIIRGNINLLIPRLGIDEFCSLAY